MQPIVAGNWASLMGHMQRGQSGFSAKYNLGMMRPELPYQPTEARRLFGSGMIGAVNDEMTGTPLHCLEERGNMAVVRVSETESEIHENGLNGDIPDSFFESSQFRVREAFSGKLACLG